MIGRALDRLWDALACRVVGSRPATLQEVVPWAPARCPSCGVRVGYRFTELRDGAELPGTPVGWECAGCGTRYFENGQSNL